MRSRKAGGLRWHSAAPPRGTSETKRSSSNNRRYINVQLPREIRRVRERGGRLSLVMMDVDNFREVNGTHGWPTGDRVLQSFASVARSFGRPTDWVARYGGEESVIVLPGTLGRNRVECAREGQRELRLDAAS